MGSQSTIPAPPGFDVPPSAGFVPDRLGVRAFSVDIDRDTEVMSVRLTPCPATATAWGPKDAAEVASHDLLAELLGLPTEGEIGAKRAAALAALGRLAPALRAELPTVAAAIIAGRE